MTFSFENEKRTIGVPHVLESQGFLAIGKRAKQRRGCPESQGQSRPVRQPIKDPEEWVTGHEPMTGAQASYLKTLSEQAHDPKAFDPELDKAEASKRIDQLKQEQGR
jgi:hypothetical protein